MLPPVGISSLVMLYRFLDFKNHLWIQWSITIYGSKGLRIPRVSCQQESLVVDVLLLHFFWKCYASLLNDRDFVNTYRDISTDIQM